MRSHFPVSLFLFLGFMFCQPKIDPEVDMIVEGTWYQASNVLNTDHTLRQEIIFKSDGTFELASKIIDKITKKDIEYFSLSTGNYQISGNRLRRIKVNEYGRIDVIQKYKREDLVLKTSFAELPVVLVSLDEDGEMLTLDYRSGDCLTMSIKNCIEVETYRREK